MTESIQIITTYVKCAKKCVRVFSSRPEKHSLIHSLTHSLTQSILERCSGQPKRNKSLFVFLARLSYDLVPHRHLSIYLFLRRIFIREVHYDVIYSEVHVSLSLSLSLSGVA